MILRRTACFRTNDPLVLQTHMSFSNVTEALKLFDQRKKLHEIENPTKNMEKHKKTKEQPKKNMKTLVFYSFP